MCFILKLQHYEYGRSGNPTRTVLETCLAALDGGKYGLTFSSGLGTTTAITQLLSSGDHIVSGDDIYGGTNRLFAQIIKRQGIETTFVDVTDLEKFKNSIKPNTRVRVFYSNLIKAQFFTINNFL